VDAAVVDLSTVRWLVSRNPDRYFDSGKQWNTMLYGAALKQGDLDWLTFVNAAFTIGMFGHETALYDKAFKEFFGLDAPTRVPGFPTI
jgi:polar amino acid transport system substrate-binding protein